MNVPGAAEVGTEAARAAAPALGTRRALLLLLAFAAMAVLHTWPLASAPAVLSRHDNGDAMLNQWIIGWVAHQLPRAPLHLFDANIFFPEHNTLAYSEHMIVQGVIGAPLFWAGASGLLVHNVVLLAGLALTAWTMSLVMFRWTGDIWASVLAGLLLGFNAYTLTELAHLQAMHAEFLPLAIYALDRLFAAPRVAVAVGLGVAVALQSLTSNYLLVGTAFAMLAAAAVCPRDWLLAANRRTLLLLVAAAILAAVIVIPFLLPYLQAQREQGLVRTLDPRFLYQATWREYLASGSRLHLKMWSAALWPGPQAALFPGILATLLALVAVASGALRASRPARMWLAAGCAGFLLSFGTRLPGYTLLYYAMPLLQGIRAQVRFGFLLLAAVAALAGFGLARVNRIAALRSAVPPAVLGIAAALLVTIEAARLPLGYVPGYEVPQVYHALLTEQPAAVVELPLPPEAVFDRNTPYMLNSTLGWWPLVNGYSGFVPAAYRARRADLAQFPADDALDVLRRIGVRYAVIHREEFSHRWPDALERLERAPALRPIAAAGDIAIYRIEDPR